MFVPKLAASFFHDAYCTVNRLACLISRTLALLQLSELCYLIIIDALELPDCFKSTYLLEFLCVAREVYLCIYMYTSYHSDNKSEKVVLSPARDDKQFTVALAFKLEVCPKFAA